MANIWKKNKDVANHPKRNNFDLSYDNHCTMKMGYLYPVFKKSVVPGDSFRIQSAFDLKLMPLVFPLQSRLRASIHFFYVRNKNLWKDYEDYMTGVERVTPLVEPYLSAPDDKIKTGSIYDFLGVPTTLVSKSAIQKKYVKVRGISTNVKTIDNVGSYLIYGSTIEFQLSGTGGRPCFFCSNIDEHVFYSDDYETLDTYNFYAKCSEVTGFSAEELGDMYILCYDADNTRTVLMHVAYTDTGTIIPNSAGIASYRALSLSERQSMRYIAIFPNADILTDIIPFSNDAFDDVFSYKFDVPSGFSEYSDLNLNLYRDNIHLKAIPFRAYESIYRAYFANDVLQPLIDDNGDKQYNKFCTTIDGGLDSTDYHLFKRNYELDFLTSAVPSPQAGAAPMVGINALGQITITDENGVTTAQAVVDESTGQITDVAITSPLASVEHGRSIMNIAQLGMNINDFRNANALQRLLEQTMRSGYRYIDYIKGHWGTAPKDQVLDMPEFLGGFSREVVIQTITSVADTGSDTLSSTLGGFGANGRVIGGSEHSITKYCDDYGWIIGVMCVSPTPAYSQLLDKSMIAGDNYLSYPFPEMNNLGMQPIPYKEVAPIQAYLDSVEDYTKSINDTFGYQRPNYDLVSSVDEVHGEFRGSLRNYLINRIFDGRPELGSSFLEIDPSEVNDVFVNQDPDDDVLIGHLRFKVDAKRPFPRVHIPGL